METIGLIGVGLLGSAIATRLQAAELLAKTKNPNREQIVAHMDGNICRCGTYSAIIAAIETAARG